jgi:hypothetical protein
MMRRGPFLLILVLSMGAALATEPVDPTHGFLVFSANGVANYVLDEKGHLQLKGKSPTGQIDDFAAAGGHIYRLDALLGSVSELNPDLTPLRKGSVKSTTGIPYWLGPWNEGMLVLNDNAVIYLDHFLKESARLPLEPRRRDQITPVLSPTDFDVWGHRGYLLANTGEVFVIPLDRPQSSGSLAAALRLEDGISAQQQWIDPEEQTLNLIAESQRDEYDTKLKPGEWRVIKEQVVFTYSLKDPGIPAQRTIVHEQREIHEAIRFDSGDEGRETGRIYERRPPYRAEGPGTGTYIGIMSRTTPTYAEIFQEKEDSPLPQRAIARLKSRGQYEVLAVARSAKGGPLWFQGKEGQHYLESDMQERVLRLQPKPYGELTALPELHGAHFRALAY